MFNKRLLDFFFFFFKQKTAYEMLRSLVGSEMCIRDRFGLELCTWSYCKASSPTVLDGRKFFCDFIPELDKYPACLLVCGTLDILVHSSRRAAHMLKGKGFQCQIAEYEARHAFVGLPPVLYFGGDSWKYLSAAATVKIVNFLDECHATSNTASSPPK
eukprot:TRINITY_DN6961_c0_g1_i9.p1 TRINITY_DN6961_c0_g1~~TRINITY_DN6961_c0_g1_i9.p1  ORF type:complete len:158 (+),score=51.60 TRINITY_DN6961_c0_g1_i9:79-552(+)